MHNINGKFDWEDSKSRIVGTAGKHGEIIDGTLYSREKPIVSFTSDLHRLAEFDGLTLINTQGELKQFLGLFIHGDLYPLSRKNLSDEMGRMIHGALEKGRASRKNFYQLRRVEYGDVLGVSDGKELLFSFNADGNVVLKFDLNSPNFGSDDYFLRKQCNVMFSVLSRPEYNGKKQTYDKGKRLMGKNPDVIPLVPL